MFEGMGEEVDRLLILLIRCRGMLCGMKLGCLACQSAEVSDS